MPLDEESLAKRLCRQYVVSTREMEWLGKLFFPGNPKMVRYRKLQLLFFTITLMVASCAVIGLLFYFVSKPSYR